ncbi:hypothetical protein D3C86_1715490 [compost metagenome]
MFISQQVFKDISQLIFTQYSPGFDIAHDLLNIPDTAGQYLHFAQSFMHQFQPLADKGKGIIKPFLQCRLQLLFYRMAHFIQLLAILLLEVKQFTLYRLPDLLQL